MVRSCTLRCRNPSPARPPKNSRPRGWCLLRWQHIVSGWRGDKRHSWMSELTMGRFNSLLIHAFSRWAWRKSRGPMCSLPSFISDFPGKGLGGEEGEEWVGRLVHPPEDAENESQEIALQKRKDRRWFRSLDSKRRRGGRWGVESCCKFAVLSPPAPPPPHCRHKGRGSCALPQRKGLVN